MPLPILPIPRFPNVPPLPGVPALARAAGQFFPTIAPLVADALGLFTNLLVPQWGIFDDFGFPLLVGDSVVGVDFKRDARLIDYPVEKGGFGSYNKVQTPFDAKAIFTIGGSDVARAAFLATCEKLVNTLTMVSLVTPEVTYASANVVHYDYRRTSRNGVTLIQVEVGLMEVRQVATTAFTAAATQEPAGASPVSTGPVQTQPPTQAQAAAVSELSSGSRRPANPPATATGE